MKLSDISKTELEAMNYDDIAYIILNEEKTKMKINVLFKKICDALELDEKAYLDKIGDFFELLTTDKRFMLEDGSWDLKELHNPKVIIDDDEEEENIINEVDDNDDIMMEEEEENESDIFYDSDTDDDIPDDDFDDFVVIDVDEEEANS